MEKYKGIEYSNIMCFTLYRRTLNSLKTSIV